MYNLRTALRMHELDINEHKTRIISAKYVFGDDWPFEFDEEITASLSGSARGDALRVLSRMVDRATITNDDGLIRHAIRAIDENKLWRVDWQLLEHFLVQCAVQFPHSFDYVARVISWRRRTESEINLSLWREIAFSMLEQSALAGRDSEAIWAIWLLKELDAKLPKKLTDILLVNSSPLVLCLVAHFFKRKMTNDRNLAEKLRQRVSGDIYLGSCWPLSLELMHLGIGDSSWKPAAGSVTSALHGNGASIVDWDARPKVFLRDTDSISDEGDGDEMPEFAIEDYGADYGDFEDDDDYEEEATRSRADADADEVEKSTNVYDNAQNTDVDELLKTLGL